MEIKRKCLTLTANQFEVESFATFVSYSELASTCVRERRMCDGEQFQIRAISITTKLYGERRIFLLCASLLSNSVISALSLSVWVSLTISSPRLDDILLFSTSWLVVAGSSFHSLQKM